MYGALESGADAAGIVQALSPEDRRAMAETAADAGASCWTRAFVLTVARKLADFVREGQNDEQLRLSVEGMFTLMDGLFGRLPNDIHIELGDLALDIYNETCAQLDRVGGGLFVPANIVAQAYAAFLRRKEAIAGTAF